VTVGLSLSALDIQAKLRAIHNPDFESTSQLIV